MESGKRKRSDSAQDEEARPAKQHYDDAFAQAIKRAGALMQAISDVSPAAVHSCLQSLPDSINTAQLKFSMDPNTASFMSDMTGIPAQTFSAPHSPLTFALTRTVPVEHRGLQVQIVRFLLGANADPNANDALWYAVRNERCDLIEELLKAKADVNKRESIRNRNSHWGSYYDSTPLMYSAQDGCVELTKLLLRYGADPNLEARNSMSAMRMAIIYEPWAKFGDQRPCIVAIRTAWKSKLTALIGEVLSKDTTKVVVKYCMCLCEDECQCWWSGGGDD